MVFDLGLGEITRFVIIEGKSDYWFYTKFIDKKACKVEIAYGCLKVIAVINNLEQTNYQKALGIIDADFRRLENETLVSDKNTGELKP